MSSKDRHIYKSVRRTLWERLTSFKPIWEPTRKFTIVRDLEAENRRDSREARERRVQRLPTSAVYPKPQVGPIPKDWAHKPASNHRHKPSYEDKRRTRGDDTATRVVHDSSHGPYPPETGHSRHLSASQDTAFQSGRGGDFGGGGASESWKGTTSGHSSHSHSHSSSDSGSSSDSSSSSSSSGD